MKFLIATKNKHKRLELSRILASLGITAVTEEELGITLPEVEETGKNFHENALLKAQSAVRVSGLPAVSDDSGLCVDALDGAPGLYSARYGGEGATDADRVQKLLGAMRGVENRSARFVCTVCCHLPGGATLYCDGTCEGSIADSPRGEDGFGYDPVFLVASGKSCAELTPAEKDAVSHRGEALRRLQEELPRFLKENPNA